MKQKMQKKKKKEGREGGGSDARPLRLVYNFENYVWVILYNSSANYNKEIDT